MALVRTTLASAVAVVDKQIQVASATSIAADRVVLIDQEVMKVAKGYDGSVNVPVLRGRDGTAQVAHVVTAGVVHGLASDYVQSPAQFSSYPLARTTRLVSVTATSTLALPNSGEDLRVVLNGTSVITLTVPVPTVELDGAMLTIISNGAAAHVITFTGGLGGAGASYDTITNNATGRFAFVVFAANSFWNQLQAVGITGTATNLAGGVG